MISGFGVAEKREGDIMGFLGGFTDRFVIALGVWPFASIMLTLPILAFLYNRDGRLRFWSVVGAYLSVLYALGLVFFTLWPLPSGDSGLGITYGVPPQLDPFAFIGDISKDGLTAVFQIVANIAFFVPLGFILRRGLHRSLEASAVISFATSLLIETAQLTGLFGIYPYSYRTFDVDDLIWNTAGALAGWAVAKLIERILPQAQCVEKSVQTHPGIVQRAVAFLLDMTIVGIVGYLSMALVSTLACLLGFDGGLHTGIAGSATVLALFVVFIVIEVLMPWVSGGQTPGGAFVRMTVEEHPRSERYRLMFYGARMLIIVGCLIMPPMIIVVGIYYLAKRQMPYDAIP